MANIINLATTPSIKVVLDPMEASLTRQAVRFSLNAKRFALKNLLKSGETSGETIDGLCANIATLRNVLNMMSEDENNG